MGRFMVVASGLILLVAEDKSQAVNRWRPDLRGVCKEPDPDMRAYGRSKG